MNLIDRLLGYVAPRAALDRQVAREQMVRLLEHNARSKRHPSRRMGNHSGDAVMKAAGYNIRQSARWLEENHAIALSLLNNLADGIVGDGTRVEPLVRRTDGTLARDVNQAIADAWRAWYERPEVTQELSGPQFERLVVNAWCRDGEVFLQQIGRGTAYAFPTEIRHAVEIIEADLCPLDHVLGQASEFTQGVRRNAWGQPLEYLFHLEHPGNDAAFGVTYDVKRVPADRILHLKNIRRIGQARGLSMLHGVIDLLLDLSDYEDSERVAARVSACQVLAVKRDYRSAEDELDGEGGEGYAMRPGAVWHLSPGESVSAVGADRPNVNLDAFVVGQLRRVAGATATSYSTIARNYNGTYSSQRQELLESNRGFRSLQAQYHHAVLRPIYREVVAEVLRNRAVNLAGVDTATLTRADFRGPGLMWIDPQKEANGAAMDIANGIRSRQQIIRERGHDPETITQELLSDPFAEARDARDTARQSDAPRDIQDEDQSDDETAAA